jgi:multiple sugar transport system substrate-binding protein
VRRCFLVSLILTMSILLFASVSIAATPKITLEFPSWQAIEPGFSDWWKELIAEFESTHPGVTIKLDQIPITRYVDTLVTRFAAGNPPDIVHIPTRNASILINNGWLEPLQNRLGPDFRDAWTPLQSYLELNGDTYGVLLLGFGYVLYYNEKMFDDAGISIPKTADELMNTAKALTRDTDGDGIIDQYGVGLSNNTHPSTFIEATRFIIGSGGHWSVDGKLALDSDAVVNGLTMFGELVRNNYSPLGVGDEMRRQMFLEGKVAMIMDGPWVLAMRENAAPEVKPHIKVAPMPFPYVTGGVSNSIHLPVGISDDRKELVWDFISLVLEPKWQSRYAELTASPPPRKDGVSEEIYDKIPEMHVFTAEAARAFNYIPPGFESDYDLFSKIATDKIIQYSTTDEPIDILLKELERELKLEIGI